MSKPAVAILIALVISGAILNAYHDHLPWSQPDLPPTQAAEAIAYSLYGGVCPIGVPRSDVCKVLFAEVERKYLAEHR